MKTSYIPASLLTPTHQQAIDKLNKECFSDVDPQEVAENFIAEPFGYIFALNEEKIIGRLALFKRQIKFANKDVVLGGMGGVCVSTTYRHQGVATEMLQHGLSVLHDEGCDVACLNVDLEKKIYGVYEKLGFTMMDRDISFENIHGQIIREPGTMFVPVCSQAVYDTIMNSTETFHYGKGYW